MKLLAGCGTVRRHGQIGHVPHDSHQPRVILLMTFILSVSLSYLEYLTQNAKAARLRNVKHVLLYATLHYPGKIGC